MPTLFNIPRSYIKYKSAPKVQYLNFGADLLFPSMQALNDTWDMMTENDI